MTELHVKANNTKSFDFTSSATMEKPLVLAPKDAKLGTAKAQTGSNGEESKEDEKEEGGSGS